MTAAAGGLYPAYVSADHDYAERLARFEAKLEPERIRATLAFAGLYQMTHEMIKNAVVDQVRGFYLSGFDETGMQYDEESYASEVLNKAGKKRVFRSSLLWLVDGDAITLAQADRLDDIYQHRHELTHELGKYIVDIDFEPNVDLFIEAIAILRDITRFWTQMEIDIGSFDEHGRVSVDDVQAGSLMMLQMCIDAYAQGLAEEYDQDIEPEDEAVTG